MNGNGVSAEEKAALLSDEAPELGPEFFANATLRRPGEGLLFNPPSIRVQVWLLQRWALALSQGDNSPRVEIERLLDISGYPTRNPDT